LGKRGDAAAHPVGERVGDAPAGASPDFDLVDEAHGLEATLDGWVADDGDPFVQLGEGERRCRERGHDGRGPTLDQALDRRLRRVATQLERSLRRRGQPPLQAPGHPEQLPAGVRQLVFESARERVAPSLEDRPRSFQDPKVAAQRALRRRTRVAAKFELTLRPFCEGLQDQKNPGSAKQSESLSAGSHVLSVPIAVIALTSLIMAFMGAI
jgi:hypothetical protein